MNWQDILFTIPQASLLLPLIFLFLLLFFLLFIYRQIALEKFASSQILNSILESRSPWIYWGKAAFFLLAWTCAVVALMGPISTGRYPEQLKGDLSIPQKQPHEITFLIDVSASMEVNDTPSRKSRLDYAKELVDEIISSLQGESVALFAFTSELSKVSPATYDYLYVRLVLRELKMNEPTVPGTNFEEAFRQLAQQLAEEPSGLRKSLFLISDGEDQRIVAMAEDERQKEILKMIASLQLEAKNITLNTIGIGSKTGGTVPQVTYQGSPVQSSQHGEILQAIAQAGKGQYYDGTSYLPFALAKKIIEDLKGSEDAEQTNLQDQLIHSYYFQIPLALAILFLAFFLLFPDSLRRVISFVIILSPVIAFAQDDALLKMGEAQAFFESKQYDRAKIIYQELLQEAVQPWERAVFMFNIGSALAAEKQWEQAEEIFKAIPLESTLAPLLAYKAKQNLVFITYHQALRQPEQAIQKLDEAISLQKEAQAAFCRLQAIKGYKACNDAFFKERIDFLEQQKLHIKEKPPAPKEEPLQSLPQPEKRQMNIDKLLRNISQMNQEDLFLSPPKEDKPHKVDKPW